MLMPASHEEVVAWLDDHAGVLSSEDVEVEHASGRVLAAPVDTPKDVPDGPVAAVDGFALSAQATVGASDYNPLPLRIKRAGEAMTAADVVPVASGDRLPDAGADTVIPSYETEPRGEVLDIYAPLAQGENVIAAGREARRGSRVLEAGRVLREMDIAMLIELGVGSVFAVRRPEVGIVIIRGDVADADGPMIRALVARDGGSPHDTRHRESEALAGVFSDYDCDLLLVIGGSGLGSNDHAPAALDEAGEVVFRGVAIRPGETATVGRIGHMPVVILPGPPLAALFAYDVLAGRAVRRLAGRPFDWPYRSHRATLTRKIASGLGRLECCRVLVAGDRAEPLAVAEHRTLSTAVRADGFVLVPPQSEGYAEGGEVTVHLYDEY